ncbi:hypothetical protein [Oryza sativa Japonica Group]|uniref:Uncharacterized protein n=1 Tax=Oryza sativa subsp. japonica TaxID=39947 RepID=Q5JLN1_ORYSJ|nr:hypothetical protein [Oryza sativa Japonica Group]
MVKRVCARVLTGEGLGRRTAAPLPSGTGTGGAQRRRGGGATGGVRRCGRACGRTQQRKGDAGVDD